MILIDSNVPMYLVGSSHPQKSHSQRLLERLIRDGERLVSNAEVLQEILHRYVAIDRRDAIQPAFDALFGVADEIFPITDRTVQRAKQIVLGYRHLSARDAVHVAVMEEHGIERILSYDSGFDSFPRIERLS